MTSKLSVSYYHPSFLKLNSRIHLLISKDPKVLYLSFENLLDFLSKVYFLSPPPSPPQAEKSYSSSRQHFFKKMFSSEREGGGELRMYKAFYQLMFLFIWSILIHWFISHYKEAFVQLKKTFFILVAQNTKILKRC